MTETPDERGMELRDLFFETSQELLQALNDEALKLEKTPGDTEIVRVIRRTVHTLKGDSAACGLREISELAHQFEDALSLEATATQTAVAEIAFSAADLFTEMIEAYRSGGELPSAKNLSKRIHDLTASAAAGKTQAAKPSTPKAPAAAKITKKPGRVSAKTANKSASKVAVKSSKKSHAPAKAATVARNPAAKAVAGWTADETSEMAIAQAAGLTVFHVVAKIDPHCAMPIAGRQLIHNAIGGVGQILAVRPDPKSPAASKQVEFVLASCEFEEKIAAKGRIPTIADDITVEVLLVPAPKKAAAKLELAIGPAEAARDDETGGAPELQAAANPPAAATPASDAHAPAAVTESVAAHVAENILRVEAGRIDSVLNLVGELIIGKSMLQQALSDFSKRYPKEPLRGKFADAIAFQARVLNDLQRSVMKIRMVPVEQLFRRFPRMVRDVSRQCGREVELSLSGHETDLDKGILDSIAEPLTHLVRNAISHGIEPAAERVQQGKPAHGRIRLNAYHHGNQVVVEVGDDGRGIDTNKIRAKAIQLGLTTTEEAARLTEAEILDFIFKPGFSTAEQVTAVSGRGVGMDVVQSVLHRLKATVSVETKIGQGTTFRLKLPLTLAIIKALLFWVEQRLYAIPLNAVLEIARTSEAEVHQVDNYEVLQLRNQVLPLLRLGRPQAGGADSRSKLFVLVIMVGERKYGLIVDILEGEEELVIKALDDQTFNTDLVSGASILGDGRVVLILNLAAVVEHVARSRPQEAGHANSGLLLSHTDRLRLSMTPSVGGQQ